MIGDFVFWLTGGLCIYHKVAVVEDSVLEATSVLLAGDAAEKDLD
jgi:hypothetical protein